MIITGATGQLGTAFQKLIPEARFLTRSDLDVAELDDIETKVDKLEPSGIINCAGYTAVDLAEEEEDLARIVNGAAVGELARVAAGRGIPFVTYSTDYVFDGTATRPYIESDATGPINAYGRTKLIGEDLALAANPSGLVIRTSWVISGTHPSFVSTMLRLAADGELRVVDDQEGCPTVTDDLAAATLQALDAGATGILHLANEGPTTWYGLARETLSLAGFDPAIVKPCATEDFPRPAARPKYSVLGSERRRRFGIEALPHWKESLPRIVDQLSSSP